MTPAVPDAALAELRDLYARMAGELEPVRRHCATRGLCCNFSATGHMLYVTGLEAAEMSRSNLQPDQTQADAGSCPFLRGKLCGIREQRAIGCRIFYCDTTFEEERNAVYEKFLRQARE